MATIFQNMTAERKAHKEEEIINLSNEDRAEDYEDRAEDDEDK